MALQFISINSKNQILNNWINKEALECEHAW